MKKEKKDNVVNTDQKNEVKETNNESKKSKYISKRTIIILVILVISLIYTYKVFFPSHAKVIEMNWHISIPDNFENEYYVATESGFHGDGERYSVYKGSSFLTELKEEKNEEMEEKIIKLFDELNIPSDKQIDFPHRYSWMKMESGSGDYMYCIYDIEWGKFYFYEFFI